MTNVQFMSYRLGNKIIFLIFIYIPSNKCIIGVFFKFVSAWNKLDKYKKKYFSKKIFWRELFMSSVTLHCGKHYKHAIWTLMSESYWYQNKLLCNNHSKCYVVYWYQPLVYWIVY